MAKFLKKTRVNRKSITKEIHISRGTKATWRGYPNVIDDIDLGE